MIADLKPYAWYKDSGIAWAQALPDTWGTERAKWLFTKMARAVRLEDDVVTCFRDGMVTLRKNRRLRGFTEAIVESGYQGIRKGDLVIHGMDAFAGAIGVSDSDGKGTPVYNVCQPRPGINPYYYAHAVREMSQSQWILALAKGIRERSTDFRYEMFGNQRVPLPPAEDQAAIVRFLDWANARLERTIRAKRRVIALLTEQKQAIIHRAVTRGLDPTVSLKSSGIPWLGDVPAHWEMQYLGRSIHLITGFPFASGGFTQAESGTRLLRGINVTPTGLRWDTVVRWRRKRDDDLEAFALEIGDIVLGMDRPIISSGVRAASVEEQDTPSLLLQRVARLRPTTRLDANFLLLLLRGRLFANYMAPIFTGISVPHLSPEQIKGFKVALPSVSEQQGIVSYVESETSGLNTVISRVTREIELLREYRTRLVADVVTGKLDVRAAAANLPEQPSIVGVEEHAELAEDVESDDEAVAA